MQAVPAFLDIRNIRLTNIGMEDALNAIDAALVARTPTQVAFVNADCVNIAAGNPYYHETLTKMDWVFCDGIGMKIAGKILSKPIRENVNGTDMFPLLCKDLASKGARLYFLGARPGVARATASRMKEQFPGLVVAGCQHGFFHPEQLPEVIGDIRASQADVIFVAMGAPRQEAWIRENFPATGATVAIAVGGLFDFYSGNIPRASLWIRRLGMEWIWRLLQEPRRLWRRYLLGNWCFMARIIKDLCMNRGKEQQT